MAWTDLAGAAIGAGASIYAANKNSSAARDAANSTKTQPYSGITPFGATFWDPEQGTFGAEGAPNPFQTLYGNIGLSSLANAGVANSMPFMGAHQDLIRQLFGANEASQPGSPEFEDVLAKLRLSAAPQEQRQNVALDNQQFATGTMGTSGGAARFQALKEAQGQTDLQRQLAAQGIASQNGNQRFANALTTVNQGMNNQQQQFNIGSAANSGQQNMFAQLLQQLGVGVSAGGGVAPGAAIYAAQQAGNVPNAVSNIANSNAFQAALSSMFSKNNNTQPQTAPPQEAGYYQPTNSMVG